MVEDALIVLPATQLAVPAGYTNLGPQLGRSDPRTNRRSFELSTTPWVTHLPETAGINTVPIAPHVLHVGRPVEEVCELGESLGALIV